MMLVALGAAIAGSVMVAIGPVAIVLALLMFRQRDERSLLGGPQGCLSVMMVGFGLVAMFWGVMVFGFEGR